MEHAASLERSTPKQQQQQQQTSLLLSQLHQVAATAVAPNGDSSFYASLGRLAGAVAVRVKQQDPANNTNNQTNNSALPLLLEGSTATSVLAKAYLLAVVRVFSTTAPTTPTPSESDASHHPHRIISHRPTADPLFPEILEVL